MVFGEIVEPSTRALCDEDFEENTLQEIEPNWKNTVEPPSTIKQILICESSNIVKLLETCVVDKITPVCELNPGKATIYKINADAYVITYESQPNVVVGKVTETLSTWLQAAETIHVLTSYPIASLQNYSTEEPCIIRSLSNKTKPFHPRLEIPNFITGLSASVLTHCAFKDLKCDVYASYIDDDILDSINVQPILNLLQRLEISPLKSYVSKGKASNSNLYM